MRADWEFSFFSLSSSSNPNPNPNPLISIQQNYKLDLPFISARISIFNLEKQACLAHPPPLARFYSLYVDSILLIHDLMSFSFYISINKTIHIKYIYIWDVVVVVVVVDRL